MGGKQAKIEEERQKQKEQDTKKFFQGVQRQAQEISTMVSQYCQREKIGMFEAIFMLEEVIESMRTNLRSAVAHHCQEEQSPIIQPHPIETAQFKKSN